MIKEDEFSNDFYFLLKNKKIYLIITNVKILIWLQVNYLLLNTRRQAFERLTSCYISIILIASQKTERLSDFFFVKMEIFNVLKKYRCKVRYTIPAFFPAINYRIFVLFISERSQ